MDVLRNDGGAHVRCALTRSLAVDHVELRGVELGARQCSLVVLIDTEAHFLRPLLTVQPSFTMSY
jgi:hypothetical protein